MSQTTINTDIVIIGAGIAGLWLHHRLNDLGYHAILVESNAIGAGQTLSSQGIIHGGAKYTLNGIFSNAASAIGEMPARWLACLEGHGEIDLSDTPLLSRHQLMWSTQSLSSKLTSFFSSKALNGKIEPIHKNQHPPFFQQAQFKGKLYQLNEPVLDVPSLIDNLSSRWRHRIICHKNDYQWIKDSQHKVAAIQWKDCRLDAETFILTGGEGTQALLDQLAINTPKMQIRPLQMVLAKGRELPEIYAHCIGASTKPIATISTHLHSDGDKVWYIGGNIAEQGVGRDQQALITETINTLKEILPWVNLEQLQWTTHCINRAEPEQKNLLRPDTAFLASQDNLHVAWPTKLALTPNLSDQVIKQLNAQQTPPSTKEVQVLSDKQLAGLGEAFQATQADNLWERSFNANQ